MLDSVGTPSSGYAGAFTENTSGHDRVYKNGLAVYEQDVQDAFIRLLTIGAAGYLRELVPASASFESVRTDQAVSEKAERRALFHDAATEYREKLDKRLTQDMVAKKAGWSDRTIVGWWLRCDSRCKPGHDRKIRNALNSMLG